MKKVIAIALAVMLVFAGTAMADDLVSILGWGIGGDTQGPLTGWVGDLWATKGFQLEAIGNGNSEEKMQAMLASGDIPDLIRFNNWEQYEIAVQAGYLLCLDDYIDQLPNTVKYAAEALQYTRDYHSDDGKLYGVPDNVGPNKFGTDAGCYAFNVRWDIYAKAGYPQAETLEDMIDVFKAMKDVYPTNEDGLPTYALNTFAAWDGGTRFSFANAVLTTLGYYEGGQGYFLDYFIPTGECNSIFEDDSAFKRAVKFLYNMNQAGLIDPDSMTQEYTTSQSKIASGQYFGCWWGGYQSAFDSLEKANADEPVGFKPVIFDEYIASTMGHFPIGTSWPLCISAKAENIEACLAYVDANADPEFLFQLYNGPKGLFWDEDENGKTYATDAYYEYADAGTYTLESGEEYKYWNGRYTLRDTFLVTELGGIDPGFKNEQQTYTSDTKLNQAWSEYYGGEYQFPIDKIIAEDRLALRPLAFVSFLPQMDDDMKLIRDSVGAIVQTNCWKMVYAANEDEFESLWQQTVQDAMALGADQVQNWAMDQFDAAFEKASAYEEN